MRIQCWDWRVESTAVVTVQETCTVRTDEAAADFIYCFNDLSFEFSALFIFFAEACRNDDEAFCAFFKSQSIDCCWTVFSCNSDDCAVYLWKVFNFLVTFYALNFSFFRVNSVNLAFEVAVEKVS